jgi:3-isopropylmalate/(R)-2-methylmalate dehydratase small subunit
MKTVKGKAIKFGNNIDTDVILPGKWLSLIDPKELAKHAMEGIYAGFPQKAENGIIIVGGKNFGCGSSREQAPLALRYAGVQCVLAVSFARIFYRNSINIGLPVIECKGISEAIAVGDEVSVDLEAGKIQNYSKKKMLEGTKMPPFIMEILSDGGLIENLRKRMNKK